MNRMLQMMSECLPTSGIVWLWLKTKLDNSQSRYVMEGPTGSSTEQNINLVLPLLLCLQNPPYLLAYPTSPGNSLRFRAIISSNHGPGRPIVNTYMTTSDLCGEGTLLSPYGRLITLMDPILHSSYVHACCHVTLQLLTSRDMYLHPLVLGSVR